MLPTFLKRGYWQNGYERTNEGYNEVFDKLREGDRIAVKRMNGKGSRTMRIMAIGRVVDIDSDGYTVFVKWLIQFKGREVPISGLMGTLYGPYKYTDQWIHPIFSI
jgi:hypothetical protein